MPHYHSVLLPGRKYITNRLFWLGCRTVTNMEDISVFTKDLTNHVKTFLVKIFLYGWKKIQSLYQWNDIEKLSRYYKLFQILATCFSLSDSWVARQVGWLLAAFPLFSPSLFPRPSSTGLKLRCVDNFSDNILSKYVSIDSPILSLALFRQSWAAFWKFTMKGITCTGWWPSTCHN